MKERLLDSIKKRTTKFVSPAIITGSVLLLAGSCQEKPSQDDSVITESFNVLVGAGDIAACDSLGDEQTAALIKKIPGVVFTVGDNVYIDGTTKQFAECYEPSWGQFKSRTKPVIGNHETYYSIYGGEQKEHAPYYDYFGKSAGEPNKGYYSYDMAQGKWHVVVLNSNDESIASQKGSEQMTWLQQDLAKHPKSHKIAIWHHPRFNADYKPGDNKKFDPFWKELYKNDTKIVINGHAHNYQRFAPLTPEGKADSDGIREFIVGTGGASLHEAKYLKHPKLEAINSKTFGVLKLTLNDDNYQWEFKSIEGDTFKDAGTQAITPTK